MMRLNPIRDGFCSLAALVGVAALTPNPNLMAQVSSTNVTQGTIAIPGEQDIFTFTLTNRGRFYFDALTNAGSLNWSLDGPTGMLIDHVSFSAADAGNGSILSLVPGSYRLTIDCDAGSTNGYAFRFLDLTAATLLTPGTVVSNTLSPGNETKAYQFASTAGDRLLFDRLFLSAGQSVWWRLIDPFGNEAFSTGFSDVTSITQRVTGTYTLLVEGFVSNDRPTTNSFVVTPQGNTPPPPFSGTPLSIGGIVAGTLANPSTNAYTFTLAAETRLSFDTLTNSPNLQWSLEGPPGLVVNNRPISSSDWNAVSLLELPAGDYQLRVRRTTTGTNSYQFRLLNLATAVSMSPGTPVTGTLLPTTATALYRFDAPSGTRLYFDFNSTNGPTSAMWRLFHPHGGTVTSGTINQDRAAMTLTIPGTYVLSIEGYPGDDPGPTSYRFNLVPVVNGAQTLTLGALTSGAILVPGQVQQFDFSLATDARLYFDSLTNSVLRWSLAGPAGQLIANRAFNASDANAAPLNLIAGDYTITVTGSGDHTGGFAFRLFDLSTAVPIAPGQPLTGSLSPAVETDAYQFTSSAGTRLFFDIITASGIPNGYWRCFPPTGDLLFGNFLADAGPVDLPLAGVYTLLIEGHPADPGIGAYTVNVVPVHDGLQLLTIGDRIQGAIATPGQKQTYTFTLAAPATLYFDSRTNNTLRWSLRGPAGQAVFNRAFNSLDTGLAPLNLIAGNYELTVTGSGDATGGFAFVLRDMSTAAPFTLGFPLSGVLDPPDETDLYRFPAAAATRVYFDVVSSTGAPNARWRCFDPTGQLVVNTTFADVGPVTLPLSGLYTLALEGHPTDAANGVYTVNIVPLNDTIEPLTLGDVVHGALTLPGQTRSYTFNLATNALLYFDQQTNTAIRATLIGPRGNVFANRSFSSWDGSFAPSAVEPGAYTLNIDAAGDLTGSFQFRLFDLTTASPITPGNGVGATLNPASETDAYRFSAAAGDRFFFDWISRTGIPNSFWRLLDPHGNRIFLSPFNSDAGTNQLMAGGTYTLLIEGHPTDSGSGAYQFNLLPLGNVSVPPYAGTPFVPGATVSSNLLTATTTNAHIFSLAAPTRLAFDALATSEATWSLNGPGGNMINNRPLSSSDGADGNPLLDLPVGAYQITVRGVAGTYSFRLVPFSGATPFTPGPVVSGSITPGRGTVLRQFTAAAGERFYYGGLPRTGFTTDPHVRIFPPFGAALGPSFPVTTDQGEFVMPHDGEYVLSVEGRVSDSSASGTYSFFLQPITDETNALAIGETVMGAISHAGQRQYYGFSLSAPARLFFDVLTGSGVTLWTLTGPAGNLVTGRQFWNSDSLDNFSLLKLAAGDYTIAIEGSSTNTPAYSFRLLDSSSAVAFTPGLQVNGSLAPGISSMLYRFHATAGEKFYYDGQTRNGFTSVPYVRIITPTDQLLGAAVQVDGDLDTFNIPLTGDYLLTVEGRYTDTSAIGNFSFVLHPVVDGTNTFSIGQTINGAIGVPGQQQYYTFTLPAATRLIFDTLSSSGFPYVLSGAGGVIQSRTLWGSDSFDGVSLLDLPAGVYTIHIEVSGATTGSYAFRLLDAGSATPFTQSGLVTNSLSPGVSTALWRFTASAGDRFYYDGRARNGFTSAPYVRIYSPAGVSLFNPVTVDSDAASFSAPLSGTYLLAVEGRYNDTSVTGNYSFILVPNPSQPPTPLFETNVAPDLIVTGLAVNPPSALQSGQAVTVSWTTRNNGNAATVGSFTERVSIRNATTSQIVANRTRFYDEAAGGSLLPSQTRAGQLAITLPDGPAGAGQFEVTVTTDTLNNIFEQNGSGSGEANNAGSLNLNTTLAPYPDLQVVSLTATPAAAWLTGSVVTVNWIVTNAGNRATLGSWTDGLIVRNTSTGQLISSRTTDYDPAAPGNGDVPPAGSRLRSTTLLTPLDAAAYGAFEITVIADSGQTVFEHNAGGTAETNNSRTIGSASAPDLVVNGLTVNANPSAEAGARLTIQWSTANQGNVPAAGVFYDRVIIRNTNTSEVLLNTALPYNPAGPGAGPIAAGGFIARSHGFDLPDGVRSVGRLAVTVSADTFNSLVEYNAGGTGESNNTSQAQITISPALYPDLIVTNVVAPTTGRPGQSVPITWTIRNVGTVPAVGPWSDHLFLSTDNLIGGDQFVASVYFTGTLTPGQSLTRTQQVTLPAFGTGNRFFVAETDASSVVFEERDTNNAAIASLPTLVPAALTLTLSPGTVVENAGQQAILATITRNSDAANPLVVALSNTRADRIVAPSSCTIPSGATSTNIFLAVIDDTIAASDVVATLIASSPAHAAATNTVAIRENDAPALTVRLSAGSAAENGAPVTATLTRNSQTNLPLVINLSSDRPGALTFPPTVTIPSGQTNATVLLTSVNDTLATGARTVTFYAAAAGYAGVSARFTLLDDDALSLTLQLSETAVAENKLNPAAVATLIRTPVSSALQRVRLGTNGGGLVNVPAEIHIPANQSAVSFNVNVHDDALAFGSQTVQIAAEGLSDAGVPIPGALATATLSVLENDGPTFFVTPSVAVIKEGTGTTVTITRNTPATNALPLSLSSNPAGQLTHPASFVLGVGQSSTNVNVAGAIDALTDGVQDVAITASALQFNPGTASIAVTDIDVPDLVVAEVTVPTNALTDATISVIWSVTNSGLAATLGTWVDEVYLARDGQGANVSLLTSVTNQGSVPVGESYSIARSFQLPAEPGTYWLLVRTDARNGISEGSERNNASLSAAIVVQPSYHATVSTEVDTAISGTPIPVSGHTFFSSDGSPAPFRIATVRVNVNQTRRTFSVLSDASGNFTGLFRPIPGEAGLYTIGADHPRVTQDPVQDHFTLLGLAAVPWELNLRLAPNTPAIGQVEIRNLSPLPLTGLAVTAEGLPLDFNVTTSVSNHLAGGQTNTLEYEITTSLTTPVSGQFNLILTSIEGATRRVPVNFVVTPPQARLVGLPATLEAGMLRGAQTLVQFDLLNEGGVASGDLTVSLPVVPWMSLISPSPIPSIAPGGRSTLVIALSPPADLPLTRYDGTLVVSGENSSLSLPFHFRALSEARGDVRLTVTDEHTYYASGAPKVTNATILLRDAISSEIVTNGVSDSAGEVYFQSLPEGNYVLEATAPRHSPTRGGVRIDPGVTAEQEVFMLRQEVTYEWRVVPSVIPDHYRVILQPQFETEVPQPNLVVENPEIVPLVFPGQTSQFAIRLRNTGLISLLRVRIPVPSNPNYIITPLVTEIEELPAQTSISVPVTIRARTGGGGSAAEFSPAAAGGCPGDDCVIQIPIDTRFRCGNNFVTRTANVSLHAVCVPDTGCDFSSFLDTSSPTFFDDSLLADRAGWDCLMGSMDECDKARVRGYLRSGDFGSVHFPPGALPPPLDGTNFGLSAYCVCGPQAATNTLFAFGTNLLNSLGFPNSGGAGSIFSFVAATVPGPCNGPAAAGFQPAAASGPGVCARVRLELSQDITMTRAAFRGTLLLDNGGISDLTGIQLSIDFRDAAGRPAGLLFAVRGPTLTGITRIDGTGELPAGTIGTVDYLFVPTLDAAPTGPVAYQIGGVLHFTMDGQALTVPLLPGAITVLPDARLQLEYFQQRDVFSDDPFTPELEPAEIFNLGLRLRNTGAGIARNFQIASVAPRIIENEKGLLIDFKLLGARIGDRPFTPSFNLNVGDVNPGQSRILLWDMTSSLQGKFIDYHASFVHVDAFGATNISLIDNVTVHEMIHVVRDDRTGADVLPDFLVNDQPDPDNLPDIVYLSQGSNAPVGLGSHASVLAPVTESNLQVQLTATLPAGWAYLRLPNPGPDFRLVSVQRSDGKLLRMPENAWTTDRTFPSSIAGAIREKTLHLFDYNSTGNYTLTFGPIAPDTNAPASSVAALPGTSPATFAVEWEGNDGSNGTGIAFFDVYVSVNGGVYSNWLARTTQRSALFDGVLGNIYAFYSRATDRAGNIEIPPAAPDAQTVASAVNTPPTLLPISDSTLDEGVLFSFRPVGLDTDAPRQALAFTLQAAPPGATLDLFEGVIRWQTTENDGGTSNRFTVVVADNGVPSLMTTQSFNVLVRELNSAPFFTDPAPEVSFDEETPLDYVAAATDPDHPAQQLNWRLEPGAPLGLGIDAATGRLNWLPSESRGPAEYLVTITVRDNGSPALSASRTLRLAVREVNRPPQLEPIATQAVLVQTTLVVTNSATDPDIPAQQFFFSLAPGAPRGARLQRTTGVFTWTPGAEYARTTNTVTVRVTDSGVPSLTSSRTFTIVVGDLLEAGLGQGIVPAGQTGSVPVVIFSTVPATRVAFVFTVPDTRFSAFTLEPAAPPLTSAALDSLGANRYRVRLEASPGQSLAGELTVSHLKFTAAAGQPSAFVALPVSEVTGLQTDGQAVPRALGRSGRVAYLGAQSLLDVERNDDQIELRLYGVPAGVYTVESTLNLNPVRSWTPFWSGPVNNLVEVRTVPPTNQAQYFRVWRP